MVVYCGDKIDSRVPYVVVVFSWSTRWEEELLVYSESGIPGCVVADGVVSGGILKATQGTIFNWVVVWNGWDKCECVG